MKITFIFLNMIGLSCIASAQQKTVFKGQDPIKGVSTVSRPVQKQQRGFFNVKNDLVFFGNNFLGARLNDVTKVNDSVYNLSITPENSPINGSAWYAFKVWSTEKKPIFVKFTYPQGGKHRYRPKISKDGKQWLATQSGTFVKNDTDSNFVLKLSVGPDTTWIAAQELVTSVNVNEWIKKLKNKQLVRSSSIGTTTEGRAIPLITIGNSSSKNVILITGRHHPPEVTGHYALQAFVESITADTDLAKRFREQFVVYVIPLLNPDGVDGGFWRHNAGGVDLNRDWNEFNQPETKAVRDFLAKVIKSPKKLWFGIDFHSTWDDIYYTVDPTLKGNLPGFIPEWLGKVKDAIPGYVPNVKPLYFNPPTFTLFSYLFETYKTEALVYEIGDDTPKDFVLKKGQLAADEFMKKILSHPNVK